MAPQFGAARRQTLNNQVLESRSVRWFERGLQTREQTPEYTRCHP